MAKYKAYPEYKDSGVELLGEVPLTWRVFKLKFGLSEPLVYGANEAALDDNPDNPRYIRITDMNPDGTLRNDTFKSLPKVISEPYMLIDGDILLARSGATVGKSFYYKSIFGPSCFAGYLIRARFNGDKIVPRLAYWFFQSSIYWQYVSGSQIQATIQNVSAEKYSDLYLSAPLGYAEQVLIADFLDHETAKIDNLIEKQQQLIELLKEKRQAVVSHAVTKGLNPDVPMKDSGVEWLGDVPKHWDVCAIKHIVSTPITDGPHETPDFIDDGIPFISAEAISSGVIDFDKKRACISIKDHKRFSKKYSPQFNDIYMVKSGATTGITAIVETYDDFNIWSPLAVIRCNDYSNPYFVINFMRSKPFQTAIELNWSYGTQQNIGMGVIGNLHIARPPVSEAIKIATHLRAKCSKFDELIDIAMMQISIMQERRTALISAAVTGKIDVRDWVAPDTQNVEEPQEATA
ncbi:TPA: restriction endonuclease subunit S [Klebsiella variicola]